jgi:guanylate kinase
MGSLVIEKEKVQELLNSAPDNIIIDDFIDKIIISAKLEKALDQLANGQFMTSEQLDEEIKKW